MDTTIKMIFFALYVEVDFHSEFEGNTFSYTILVNV